MFFKVNIRETHQWAINGRLTSAGRAATVCSVKKSSFPSFSLIEHLFMLKICDLEWWSRSISLTHMMHYHVWGCYRAKFDDDDSNSFWGTDRHTHTTQTLVSSILNFFSKSYDFEKQKLTTPCLVSIDRKVMRWGFWTNRWRHSCCHSNWP